MTTRRAVASVVVGLAIVIAGCAPATEFVLVNRSGRAIALFPGAVVPPCETARFTREQITAGNAELRRWFLEEAELDGWVPSGAVQLTRGVSGAPAGAPNPMTLIVSSEEPRIVYGFVPEDLPACGGEPVGIE